MTASIIQMKKISKEVIFHIFSSGSSRSVMLKRNIAGSLLAKGVSILISLVLVPMTLGYVTPEIYGIWLTLSSIIHWLSFFDIGFTHGLKNKLAEALALADFEKGRALVSTTYTMMFIVFIPLGLVLCLCVPLINWTDILNVNLEHNQEIAKTMYILIWAFCLQMIVNVLSTVIMAYQKVALSSVFLVIGNLMSLLAVYLLTLYCDSSLFLLASSISFLPIIVILIAGYFLYRGPFRLVCPSFQYINIQYIKELFGLGYRFFLIQIQYLVLFQTTNFLISNLSGPEDVAVYNIAYKYLNVAMMVFSIILTPLWPAFTDAYAKNDYRWMTGIYSKMTRIFYAVSIALFVMVIISPIVYKIWLGDKISIPITMSIVVSIYMIVNMWDSLQINIINGIGKLRVQVIVTTLGLVLHLPLSYLLGQFIGCYGVLCSMILIVSMYSLVMTIQAKLLLNRKAFGIWNK